MTNGNPIQERLNEQIDWYDKKSLENQKWFKRFKITTIGSAALIPFLTGLGEYPILTGGLGVLIAIVEGLQHINQYQHNWITYRSTCEALKHEKFLFLGNAGPYKDNASNIQSLAERIESIISHEHSKWVLTQNKVGKENDKSG